MTHLLRAPLSTAIKLSSQLRLSWTRKYADENPLIGLIWRLDASINMPRADQPVPLDQDMPKSHANLASSCGTTLFQAQLWSSHGTIRCVMWFYMHSVRRSDHSAVGSVCVQKLCGIHSDGSRRTPMCNCAISPRTGSILELISRALTSYHLGDVAFPTSRPMARFMPWTVTARK